MDTIGLMFPKPKDIKMLVDYGSCNSTIVRYDDKGNFLGEIKEIGFYNEYNNERDSIPLRKRKVLSDDIGRYIK